MPSNKQRIVYRRSPATVHAQVIQSRWLCPPTMGSTPPTIGHFQGINQNWCTFILRSQVFAFKKADQFVCMLCASFVLFNNSRFFVFVHLHHVKSKSPHMRHTLCQHTWRTCTPTYTVLLVYTVASTVPLANTRRSSQHPATAPTPCTTLNKRELVPEQNRPRLLHAAAASLHSMQIIHCCERRQPIAALFVNTALYIWCL